MKCRWIRGAGSFEMDYDLHISPNISTRGMDNSMVGWIRPVTVNGQDRFYATIRPGLDDHCILAPKSHHNTLREAMRHLRKHVILMVVSGRLQLHGENNDTPD